MNNPYLDRPPSYTQLTEESILHSPNDRAASYTVPPEQQDDVRYPVSNERVVPFTEIGSNPVQCRCAKCHSLIITHVRRTPGFLVWLLCAILIFFGCWLGCCLIPFCIGHVHNIQHCCPNCNALIGEYRPL